MSPAMTMELSSLRGALATKQSTLAFFLSHDGLLRVARNDGMRTPPAPANTGTRNYAGANFFISCIDAIFTTLFARPFTKLFDVNRAKPGNTCLWRAGNAD
jgi:hypothetical protein